MSKNLLIITQKVDENDQLLGFFISWIQRLANKFEQVTVLCLQKGTYDLPANVSIISLGKDEGLSKLSQLLNFYKQIFQLRGRYDAVMVHMNPIWMALGGVPWRLMSKRAILWYTHKAVTLKLRMAVLMADTILTASSESFRLKSSKMVVTGHGIDTGLFKPDPSRKLPGLRLLSVGRIAPIKNYEILVRAAGILRDEGGDFSVTMVGEPALAQDVEYEKRLKNMIDGLGLTPYFKFVGKVNNEDLVPYYQSHSIFVHLSRTGSLDKVILEAMACNMSVVSCNDASRAFLPPSVIFSENDENSLAQTIKNVSSISAQLSYRQYVIGHHDLGRLIDTLSSIL